MTSEGDVKVVLSNGVEMPSVGLGTYQMNSADLETALPAALDAGYRAFDTAASYKNEKFIGEILSRELLKRNLTREDVFITTKLRPADQGYDKALAALCTSAGLLGGYVDLFLIHWPGAAKLSPGDDRNRLRRVESWRALQDAYTLNRKLTAHSSDQCRSDSDDNCYNDSNSDNGACSNETVQDDNSLPDLSAAEEALKRRLRGAYVRAIGVSNFTVRHLDTLAAAPDILICPHVNQCELHPAYHPEDLREYCRQHSIHLQAYSSLGCGALLADSFLDRFPQIHHMAGKRIQSLIATEVNNAELKCRTPCNDSSDVLSMPVPVPVPITAPEAAADHLLRTCTVGVYLRWARQHGYSIIPKSRTPQRIRDNFAMSMAGAAGGSSKEAAAAAFC